MACCEREVLYQVLAGLFSILTAVCFPFLTLLFGNVFKQFINYNLAVQISSQNLTTYDYYCRLSENEDIAEYLEFPARSHQKLHIRIAYLTFLNLAVSLVFFVVAALSRSLSAVAAAQMGKRLRQESFAALLRKNFGFFEENLMTDLPSTLLLEGIEIIEIGMTCSIVLMQRSVTIVTCLVIGFTVNWRLTLAISFLLPFLMIFIYILVQAISLIAAKEQDALIHASSIAEESLLFIETVKIFEGQQQEMKRYLRQIERANKESRKILVLTALMVGMLYFFILTFFTVGSWFGFHLLLQCQCEASDIILVIAEVVICGFSISELLPAIGEVLAAFQSAALIKRVIKERSKPCGDGMSLNVFEGAIEFSDVTFSYPTAPVDTVLDGISFKVHPRQTLALVGRSGCGKSTIMKLIQRLYELEEDGMIRFDNTDGKYLDLQWLRNQIGLVSKETTLFNAPIVDNIAYGKDGSTIDETIRAAKLANAHSLIAHLPYGYASIVGGEEGGVSLNQEQEVLISIARALIRNPKILLIDLTGYDFDKEAEQVVIKGINSARKGRTTIIIPNRLSTIAQHAADVIACIDNGRVVEEGDHSGLMERNGLYKSLVMGEVHRDEFSSSVTVEDNNVAEDTDSNRLIDEPIKYNGNDMEGASEDSPLLTKQCGIETADSSKEEKTFTISLYREVLGLVFNRIHWLVLAFSMLFFVLAGATLSSFFILFEKLAEHFNNTSPDEVSRAVEIYSPLYSILGLIVMVLNLIGYTSLCVCEENLNFGIRQKTFSGLLSQRLTWFSNKSIGTLSNMLSTDAAKISQVLSIRIGSIAWSVTAVLGAFSASFILCWPIGIILTPSYLWLLLAGYLHCKLTKRYTDYRKKVLKKGAKMATEAVERIGTVVPFGMEGMFIRKYSDALEEPFRCDLKHAAILGVTYGLSQMLVFLFIGFGYLIGTFLILSLSFQFTYSDVLTSLFTIWFASQIFKGRFDIMSGLEDGARSSRRVLKYLNIHSSAARNPKQQKNIPEKLKYSLQLKNVWNGKTLSSTPAAPQSSPVLSVKPGETLALVGPEFAVNNSVLSLVEKIDSPVPNTLLLDGIDICELNSTWLQRQIGVVSRYPVLFDMSIADNIRYGVNHKLVSDKNVVDAAKAVGVHDILRSLPQSYETLVGFNGYKLTLEQRMGVALARAVIRDPKILFMDDPPNSIEPSMIKALKKASEGRTTVVIANRLSTMQSADNIAVIHKGTVLEQGTHSELIDRKGSYFIMLKQL